MDALERILQLKNSRNMSDVALEEKLELNPKTVSNWKRGKSTSYLQLLPKIAALFGVSTDYLLGVDDININESSVLDKIALLLQKSNQTQKNLTDYLGISNNVFTDWKSGRNKSYTKHLPKIAEFFGVSVDYLLGRENSREESLPNNMQPVEIVRYPVIGRITAGYTGLAVEEYTGDYIEVPSYIMRGHKKEDFFVLEIQGDSMSPKLLNGDRVLVERCDSVDSGTIVVLLYNGSESTVKQVRYVAGEDWLELVPVNPDYPVKRIEGPDLERCRVLGKIVYLFRKM